MDPSNKGWRVSVQVGVTIAIVHVGVPFRTSYEPIAVFINVLGLVLRVSFEGLGSLRLWDPEIFGGT